MGKKMYFNGEGVIPIKRGDTRYPGDLVNTDELDPKTVKRLIKKGWLVESPVTTLPSPTIAEYRTRLAKLEVENDNLKNANAALEDEKEEAEKKFGDEISELKNANAALANANKELADTTGAGPKKPGRSKGGAKK